LVVLIAVVVICVPLVGEFETSFPPCVVPTEAETAFAKVGVRLTVAPRKGVVEEAEIEEVLARTTLTLVVAVFAGLSCDVAVMVTLPAVAGAVQAPVLAFMAPALADQLMLLVTPPVAVVEKVVELLTVRVATVGVIAFTTTVCGVTETELSA
jgi:hypothetical protein